MRGIQFVLQDKPFCCFSTLGTLAPISGTDLPRSLVVLGRVLSFLIDFFCVKTSRINFISLYTIKSFAFAKYQAVHLNNSRFSVAKILLNEHHPHPQEINKRVST